MIVNRDTHHQFLKMLASTRLPAQLRRLPRRWLFGSLLTLWLLLIWMKASVPERRRNDAVQACDGIVEGFPMIVTNGKVVRLSDQRHRYARDDAVISAMQRQIQLIPNNVVYCFALGDTSTGLEDWPVLSFSAEREYVNRERVVLIPDVEALNGHQRLFDQVNEARALPFRQRQSMIHWRGSTTGATYSSASDFRKCARVRFLDYVTANENVKQISDVGFTQYVQFDSPNVEKLFASRYPLAPYAGIPQALKYKYLVDIDGNANAYSRLAWSLVSGSLVLKHRSKFMQWYYPNLVDGVQYRSIDEDFSNLRELFDWAEAHADEAERITQNAKVFAQSTFNAEAIDLAFVAGLQKVAEISHAKRKPEPL